MKKNFFILFIFLIFSGCTANKGSVISVDDENLTKSDSVTDKDIVDETSESTDNNVVVEETTESTENNVNLEETTK